MADPGLLPLAVDQGVIADLITKAGAACALAATIGMLLLLPLYLAQRREVLRLLDWQQREPERGEAGLPPPHTGEGPVPSPAAYPATGTALTPAERITLDRPALERITAERAALQSPSFFRRLAARGPRHPLVLSLVALLIAAVVVIVVAAVGRNDLGGGGTGANLDRGAVSVVVLNGSSQGSLADKLADTVDAAGFTEVRTGPGVPTTATQVLFAKQQRQAAGAVGRELGVKQVSPLDRATRAMAPGADVVVVAGEDDASGK